MSPLETGFDGNFVDFSFREKLYHDEILHFKISNYNPKVGNAAVCINIYTSIPIIKTIFFVCYLIQQSKPTSIQGLGV